MFNKINFFFDESGFFNNKVNDSKFGWEKVLNEGLFLNLDYFFSFFQILRTQSVSYVPSCNTDRGVLRIGKLKGLTTLFNNVKAKRPRVWGFLPKKPCIQGRTGS